MSLGSKQRRTGAHVHSIRTLAQGRLGRQGMTENKQCSMCLRVLPMDDFYRKKCASDGKYPYCKSCSRERRLQYFTAPKAAPGDILQCLSCRAKKPASDFPVASYERTGRKLHCVKCCIAKKEASKPKGQFPKGRRDKGGRKSPKAPGRPKADAPGGSSRPFKRYE